MMLLIRTHQPNFAELEKFGTLSPVGRMGEPGEIASLGLYLASDEASFCTGAEFVADGGATAM
jgi:3alpha(or 20beta)-hydroxysteroid dehydrogenase